MQKKYENAAFEVEVILKSPWQAKNDSLSLIFSHCACGG